MRRRASANTLCLTCMPILWLMMDIVLTVWQIVLLSVEQQEAKKAVKVFIYKFTFAIKTSEIVGYIINKTNENSMTPKWLWQADIHTYMHTLWGAKGQRWILKKLKSSSSIYCVEPDVKTSDLRTGNWNLDSSVAIKFKRRTQESRSTATTQWHLDTLTWPHLCRLIIRLSERSRRPSNYMLLDSNELVIMSDCMKSKQEISS